MNMIERVGRALAAEEGYAYDPLPYNRRARAAIEAMRDLTPNMEYAGSEGLNWAFQFQWERAIDAALVESGPDQS